jgi:hypothetical protein
MPDHTMRSPVTRGFHPSGFAWRLECRQPASNFFFPGMSMVDESSLRWRATAKIELAHAAAAKPLANSGAGVWSMRRATLAAR